MIFRYLKNWLYRKAAIRRRDIIFIVFFIGIFYLLKPYIIGAYLKLLSEGYDSLIVFSQSEKVQKTYDVEKAMLAQENVMLHQLLNLPYKKRSKVIFGKVMTNIYSSSSFWILVKDSTKIKEEMPVWAPDIRQKSLLSANLEKNENINNIKFFEKDKKKSEDRFASAIKDQEVANRLIGFVQSINGNYIKIRPITHYKARFSAKTTDGIGMLLKGNGKGLDIVLANAEKLPENELILFDEKLVVAVIKNQQVKYQDFASITWVGISI